MIGYAWALDRALAYAVATAVTAIVVATLISGAEAERFATTAYVAAIVAAVVLTVKWFVPKPPSDDVERAREPKFPAIFTFAVGVAAFVSLGAAFAGDPGTEVLAVAACLGLIVVRGLVRGGAVGAVGIALARGGRLAATTRYAVVVGAVALAFSALFASQQLDGLAKLAYAAIIVATVAIGAAMIARTPSGERLLQRNAHAATLLSTPASAATFARTAEYAVATAVAALILAAVVPEAYAERFTTTAYVALLFAALGVGMTWHLRGLAGEAAPAPRRAWQSAAWVAAFLLVGSALAPNAGAEAVAVCACLYLIGAVISKRAGAT